MPSTHLGISDSIMMFQHSPTSTYSRPPWEETALRLLGDRDISPAEESSLNKLNLSKNASLLLALSCPLEDIRIVASQEVTRRLLSAEIKLEEVIDYFYEPKIYSAEEFLIFNCDFDCCPKAARRLARTATLFSIKQALEEEREDLIKCNMRKVLEKELAKLNVPICGEENFCDERVGSMLELLFAFRLQNRKLVAEQNEASFEKQSEIAGILGRREWVIGSVLGILKCHDGCDEKFKEIAEVS